MISQQGMIRRFRRDNHNELYPPIHTNRPIRAGACSLDGRWLLTEFGDPESGRFGLEAWFVGNSYPFFRIKLPAPRLPGSRRIALKDGWTRVGRLCPIGRCSFVFQRDHHLIRVDLPEVPSAQDQVEDFTQAALGVRKNAVGELQILSAEEFQKVNLKAHESQ